MGRVVWLKELYKRRHNAAVEKVKKKGGDLKEEIIATGNDL